MVAPICKTTAQRFFCRWRCEMVAKSLRGNHFETLFDLPPSMHGGQSKHLHVSKRFGGRGTKYLHKQMPATEENWSRARHLLSMESQMAPFRDVLCWPVDLIALGSDLEIIYPYLENHRLLSEVLHEGEIDPYLAHNYAYKTVWGASALESKQIFHGDAGTHNLVVNGIKLSWIDFENSAGTNLMQGEMGGAEEFADPCRFNGHPTTAATESFSLAVILHYLLVGVSPWQLPADEQNVTVREVMDRPWSFDPARDGAFRAVNNLHPFLIMLLRDGLGQHHSRRPRAAHYFEILKYIMLKGNLILCHDCGRAIHLHTQRRACAACDAGLARTLVFPNGRSKVVHEQEELVLGTNDLEAPSSTTSKQQAMVTCQDGYVWVADLGNNGQTWLSTPTSTSPLGYRQPVRMNGGDYLFFDSNKSQFRFTVN